MKLEFSLDMQQLVESSSQSLEDKIFTEFITSQINFESRINKIDRKSFGIFLTNHLSIIDSILDIVEFNELIFSKKILEPSCGHGILILRLLFKLYALESNPEKIQNFIENNIFFIDIDPKMIEKTQQNIKKVFCYLFKQNYRGSFNSFVLDFTYKLNSKNKNINLSRMYNNIDYIIGNPPYVTLYGRRDQKKSELQRNYYLNNYNQFPQSLKNGKINYVMLFLEHSLNFLKYDGKLSFILDMSFFETAYVHTRKYLLDNTQINSIIYNINNFDVASGQLILKLTKKLPLSIKKYPSREQFPDPSEVKVINVQDDSHRIYNQFDWYQENDEYKFRIFTCEESDFIISHIINFADKTLKELYPKKNLRTCAMLLDMEDKFVFEQSNLKTNIKVYPYYRGSKSLKFKFCQLEHSSFFYYDKKLQDEINEHLKADLARKGIKNKKRIGLGEDIIYDYPKVYIRQSAKSIIATYDGKPSAANNSLYVFTLRNNSESSIKFLKFLCGYLNSDLVTFFCQKRRIIRYGKGKQPQIKISDLYSLPIPSSESLKSEIAMLVNSFYAENKIQIPELLNKINELVYQYYNIDTKNILFIEKSIQSF